MNVPGRGHAKNFIRDFKGFARDEEVAEIPKAVVEMTHSFTLGVGGDDIEDGEVGPEELTGEELWIWTRNEVKKSH